jgi:ribosomal protein S18 acetylase RimI-like enzyme
MTGDTFEIIDYKPAHREDFFRLNRTWIEQGFVLEPIDLEVLSNPEKYIIEQGGLVLVGLLNQRVVATSGLIKNSDQNYELTKLTVDESCRGQGFGEKITLEAINKARELGATEVELYTNSKQKAAIAMYEKLGFEHLPLPFKKYQRADVYMLIKC